jgi:hypothetical protein
MARDCGHGQVFSSAIKATAKYGPVGPVVIVGITAATIVSSTQNDIKIVVGFLFFRIIVIAGFGLYSLDAAKKTNQAAQLDLERVPAKGQNLKSRLRDETQQRTRARKPRRPN